MEKKKPAERLPETSPGPSALPALESLERIPNTIDRIRDFVKCTVFNLCADAEVRRETKKAVREMREPPMVADLAKLQPYHSHLGDSSMSRRLLFGAEPKVRKTYGSFASEADRNLWDTLMKLPDELREKNPFYRSLVAKRGDAVAIPETASIDFRQNLKSLWEYKIKKYG
jgi:hypothetical protein